MLCYVESLLKDDDVPELWSVVTNLEIQFAALRSRVGLPAAVDSLARDVAIQPRFVLAKLLATAVAALDETGREKQG
jgi:hypothetical protein